MKLGVNFGVSSRSSERSVLAGGFTAASISNLDLWYDFSTLSEEDGTAVSSFANAGAAGSNYDLSQGTGAVQPNVDNNEISNTILTVLALISDKYEESFKDELIILSQKEENIKIREFSMKILAEHY